MMYPKVMTWFEGHDDEMRLIAYRLAEYPELVDKWTASALRAGEFQWAIESLLAEAAKKQIPLPHYLVDSVRTISSDLLPKQAALITYDRELVPA